MSTLHYFGRVSIKCRFLVLNKNFGTVKACEGYKFGSCQLKGIAVSSCANCIEVRP